MSDQDPRYEHPPRQMPAQEQIAPAQEQAKRLPWFRLGAGTVGLVVVAAVAFSLLGHGSKPVAASALSRAPLADLIVLGATLNPNQSQGMVNQAEACKLPLSAVQIWHDPNVPDSVVQIKSGGYVSPPIPLTSIPKMVALPYPAPYPTGAGTLTLLGNAQGVELSLSPTASFPNLSGAAPINVLWNTGSPCQ